MMPRDLIAALLIAVALGCGSAGADQSDDRLDGLFAKLKETGDQAEGRRISQEIRIIWRQTENPAADEALNSAGANLFYRRFEQARAALDEAVAAAPDLAEAWSRRAVVHYLLDDLDSAVADIRRALALEPRHFVALAELGVIFMRLEDYPAAKSALAQALEINPHLAATRHNLELVERRLAGEPT